MYRNYHATYTVGKRGESSSYERSIFVFDIGEGTKRVARELVRAETGASSVRLHRGRRCEKPRAGTAFTFDEKAMNAGLSAVNKATAKYNAAKADGKYVAARIGKAKSRAPRPVAPSTAKAKAKPKRSRKQVAKAA